MLWGIYLMENRQSVQNYFFFQTFGIVEKIILRTLSIFHQYPPPPPILGSFRAEKMIKTVNKYFKSQFTLK